MIGLLLKDVYTMRQYIKTLLFMLIFFAMISAGLDNPATFFEGFIILMSMMLTISSFSYDDLAKWDRYALSLPITRKEVVAGKYLLSIVLCIAATVVSFLISLVILTVKPVEGFGLAEQLYATAAIVSAAFFFTGILLPLTFKFGVEKSRILLFVVFAAPSAAVIAFDKLGIPVLLPSEASLISFLKLFPLIMIPLYYLSYRLSVQIFSGKEF
jgi:ABC-type transport system involved in multi-copper enzyme maturation permease subunit